MAFRFGYEYGSTEICNVFTDKGKDHYRAVKHHENLWNGCILTPKGWTYIPGHINKNSWLDALSGCI
jgi:hypothetical protein